MKTTTHAAHCKQIYLAPTIEIVSISSEGIIASSLTKTDLEADGPARSQTRKPLFGE